MNVPEADPNVVIGAILEENKQLRLELYIANARLQACQEALNETRCDDCPEKSEG